MKRYIALDIGDVRIGVARSDIMGIIASPLETINRKKIKSVKRIAEICKENDTNLIVVGERFSTVIADNILKELNKNGAIEKRKVVDKVAASIILQTYLDMKK